MKSIKGYAWKNERTAAFYHATAEQEKESKFNRNLAIASFAVSIFATLFTVITTLIR